jgi:hypothetical protein
LTAEWAGGEDIDWLFDDFGRVKGNVGVSEEEFALG